MVAEKYCENLGCKPEYYIKKLSFSKRNILLVSIIYTTNKNPRFHMSCLIFFGARRETCPVPGTPCDEKPNRWLFPQLLRRWCRCGFKSSHFNVHKNKKLPYLLQDTGDFIFFGARRRLASLNSQCSVK